MTESDETGACVARVLGPAGPEVSCETCFELLDRYVELEAEAPTRTRRCPASAAHLEGCPACREEHESLLALVAEPIRA